MTQNRPPTARQSEVVAAVRELGSIPAAAAALGVSRTTVETTLARYHVLTCDVHLRVLEAELAILRERDAVRHLTGRLEVVTGRLERLAVPVSHRRIADGGTHVERQRRAALARAASGPGRAGR